jgi:hypothetical protein
MSVHVKLHNFTNNAACSITETLRILESTDMNSSAIDFSNFEGIVGQLVQFPRLADPFFL